MNTCNNKWEICNYDAFLVNPSVCHLIFDGICNVYLHLSARLNEKPTVTNGFTDAAGCRGDQLRLLWLWRRAALLPSVAAHFPWGDFTYNICAPPTPTPSHTPPPPPHSSGHSGPASFSRGSPPTHLLRGSEVTIQTRTYYHNLAASVQKNKCFLFSERWPPFRTRKVLIFLNGRILFFTALLQMWNLQRLATWSHDRQIARASIEARRPVCCLIGP